MQSVSPMMQMKRGQQYETIHNYEQDDFYAPKHSTSAYSSTGPQKQKRRAFLQWGTLAVVLALFIFGIFAVLKPEGHSLSLSSSDDAAEPQKQQLLAEVDGGADYNSFEVGSLKVDAVAVPGSQDEEQGTQVSNGIAPKVDGSEETVEPATPNEADSSEEEPPAVDNAETSESTTAEEVQSGSSVEEAAEASAVEEETERPTPSAIGHQTMDESEATSEIQAEEESLASAEAEVAEQQMSEGGVNIDEEAASAPEQTEGPALDSTTIISEDGPTPTTEEAAEPAEAAASISKEDAAVAAEEEPSSAVEESVVEQDVSGDMGGDVEAEAEAEQAAEEEAEVVAEEAALDTKRFTKRFVSKAARVLA